MNGRSIRCKLEEVQCLVATKNVAPDILALTETWIKDNEIKYFKMNGFNSFLAGRKNKSGGGVGILIKNGWGIPSITKWNTKIIISDSLNGRRSVVRNQEPEI